MNTLSIHYWSISDTETPNNKRGSYTVRHTCRTSRHTELPLRLANLSWIFVLLMDKSEGTGGSVQVSLISWCNVWVKIFRRSRKLIAVICREYSLHFHTAPLRFRKCSQCGDGTRNKNRNKKVTNLNLLNWIFSASVITFSNISAPASRIHCSRRTGLLKISF